jgi:hypothetical protein
MLIVYWKGVDAVDVRHRLCRSSYVAVSARFIASAVVLPFALEEKRR